MKCVLIANGVIAAVSECSVLPTSPGWKLAWHAEAYNIGEPEFLFDEKLKRKPVDAQTPYGEAKLASLFAVNMLNAQKIAAEKAKGARIEAEKTVDDLKERLHIASDILTDKIEAEKSAILSVQSAERTYQNFVEKEKSVAESETNKRIVESSEQAQAQAEADKKALEETARLEKELAERKAVEQAEAERLEKERINAERLEDERKAEEEKKKAAIAKVEADKKAAEKKLKEAVKK
jgi:chemosensory pili system protein ChpA (sensor histidine kinase/response regulator)